MAQQEEIDLLAMLSALWREKVTLIACGLLALTLGAIYAFVLATPLYSSTSSLKIELQAPPIVDIEAVVAGSSTEDSAMNTEVDVIQSRGVLEKLVKDLGLTEDPEFNPELRPEPVFSIRPLVDGLRGAIGAATDGPAIISAEQATLNETVDTVAESIAATVRQDRFIFDITATTESPGKSLILANRLAEIYIDDQIAQKFAATEEAITWLSERVSELERDLRERREELKVFRTRSDVVSLEAVEALNRQLADTRDRLADAETEAAVVLARLGQIENARTAGNLAEVAAILNDVALSRLQSNGGTLSTPAISDRIDALVDDETATLNRLEQNVVVLRRSSARLERQVSEQSESMAQFQELELEIQSTATLYETFLSRLKEATVQRGLQQADSRVLSAAVPGRYVAPRKSVILVLSLALGLILGAVMIFARQFLNRGFRTGDELEGETGLTVLGQIPVMPIRRRDQLLSFLSDKPTSAASESIRNMRTSLLLSMPDNPPQIIMSTSSLPGEGKTTQSISLAHNLSSLGKKVLLIEGDVRRRTLDEYFTNDLAGKDGDGGILSAMTVKQENLDAFLVRDPRMKADVLLGQRSNVNAADIFSSDAFSSFLDRLRKRYDFIVIDTPPVLVVPDARVIGQYADAILFNVCWNKTSQAQVREALRQLRTVNLQPTGLVLSRIDGNAMKRYGYGGKYGAYGSYGKGYYDA